MFVIDNAIRSAMRDEASRLSILVLNDNREDYIHRFSFIDHDFYIINEMFGNIENCKFPTTRNIHFANSHRELNLRNIDVIIVFDRLEYYEKAKNISNAIHAPIIVIDTVTQANTVPSPHFTEVSVKEPKTLFRNNGTVTVGTTQEVSKSWNSVYQNYSTTIPFPAMRFDTGNGEKILIAPDLPDEYLKTLPINIDDRFTRDAAEASIYLHLWKNITPLTIDCMASMIPVVTFKSRDFEGIIKTSSCVLIEDLLLVNDRNFVKNICSFGPISDIKNNAFKIVSQNTVENFKTAWENMLVYISNSCYLRGLQ